MRGSGREDGRESLMPGVPGAFPGPGQNYGDVPKKFNTTWKLLFFGCACVVTGGSLMGLISMLLSVFVSPFDLIIFGYLTLFGLVMVVLDVPYEHPGVHATRMGIYKFCRFLTRFVGRGIFYMFLGCMLLGALWDNNVAPFIGFIIGGFLFAVGISASLKGFRLTKKLNSVRQAILNRGGPTPSICPPAGLKGDKFGELALRIQGVPFTQEELGYIVNALSTTVHADDVISQREFENWLKDPMPVLI